MSCPPPRLGILLSPWPLSGSQRPEGSQSLLTEKEFQVIGPRKGFMLENLPRCPKLCPVRKHSLVKLACTLCE